MQEELDSVVCECSKKVSHRVASDLRSTEGMTSHLNYIWIALFRFQSIVK